MVALKRARVGPLSEVASDKAQEEAQLLMKLSQECPQILRCYDFRLMSSTLPMLELMLEFAPLGDLSRRIRQHKEWCSETTEVAGMPEPEVVSYGSDIAAGLSYLHQLRPKILHRDIKPANILLFEEEVIPRAKLADFGIAKILELENSMAGAATVIGTPHYFAPELCRGEQYDERADAWALGCILYEMLCLHRPFHQAEGNLAILAVRISEGKFDRAALEKQAEHYNGGLILALTGLLCPSQEQRTRARDVLESLQRLQARYCPQRSAPASTEWWRTRLEDTGASKAEEVREKSWEGSSADSWHNATLAQLEGLLSQLQSDASRSARPRPEATFGAEPMQQEAATSASFASFSPSASSRTPAASPSGLSPQEPRFGSEPGTEYLGEAGRGRWSPRTTPSSAQTPPCRSAWGEAPTFGSPLGEPENDRTRPPTSPLTRIFLRPLQRHDTTRPREGKWHCSEISEDEVIFCFAPAEWAASKASPGGAQTPPPSPMATMAGWQEVEVPGATLRPEARSQRRFHSWAMSSLVPEEAQLWKAKVLPFFDEFASTCSSSRRSPGCTAESFFDTKASKTSETWISGSSMKTVGTPSGSKAAVKPPSTPQEVGQWLSSHDALQSVTGDAMKSACGWSSGFRKDPMSMEEVLNVRILERSNAAFAKRKKELELYKGLTR